MKTFELRLQYRLWLGEIARLIGEPYLEDSPLLLEKFKAKWTPKQAVELIIGG